MIRRCPSCDRSNRIPAQHLADTGKCGACKAALPPSDVPLDVDAKQFDEIVAHADVPVLVDFWAPWCGPCRTAAPYVTQVAAQAKGRALVLKLNTEDHPAVAQRIGVRGIPMFVVFDKGKRAREHVGLATAAQLSQLLRGV